MFHLLTALTLYAALVAQVAFRFGGAGAWTPSIVLLVGLGAARRTRGGVFWAAIAGLICDALAGRPLGVTMLAATLVAAALSPRRDGSGSLSSAVWAAAAVFVVEAAARVLAATVVAQPDYLAELLGAMRVAVSTLVIAVMWSLLKSLAFRLGRSRAARPAMRSPQLRTLDR